MWFSPIGITCKNDVTILKICTEDRKKNFVYVVCEANTTRKYVSLFCYLRLISICRRVQLNHLQAVVSGQDDSDSSSTGAAAPPWPEHPSIRSHGITTVSSCHLLTADRRLTGLCSFRWSTSTQPWSQNDRSLCGRGTVHCTGQYLVPALYISLHLVVLARQRWR